MSLKLIAIKSPALTYIPNGPGPAPTGIIYNEWLITPPRQYVESLSDVNHFFYEPNNDRYVAFAYYSSCYWPGWRTKRHLWDTNGNLLASVDTNLMWAFWTGSMETGGWNKIYACQSNMVREVDWGSCAPVQGGFVTANWPNHPNFGFAAVNRQDHLLIGVTAWNVEIWDYASLTKLASIVLPHTVADLGYEDNELVWFAHTNGLVSKLNYQRQRFEVLTSVQNPYPGEKYLVAFDQKRKQVALLRKRPDAANGSCQVQMEFYKPYPVATQITEPVPVTSPRVSSEVVLAYSVIGDSGEGMAARGTSGALTNPAQGRLLTATCTTTFSGEAQLRYQAPDAPGTETLTVSTDTEV